jgi:hypothetical protein
MKTACWIYLVLWAWSAGAVGQVITTHSKWDAGLPAVELRDVHLQADSLNDSWQKQLGQLGVRTVLYKPDLLKTQSKFVFDAEQCTVRNVLDAVVAAYPDFTYTQDGQTGVIWLHPKSVPYTSILGEKVKVRRTEIGVPMLTGVLDNLAHFESLGVESPVRHSSNVLGTYDYPVDLPSGIYSVRDILNLCCIANPTRTFFAWPDGKSTGVEPHLVDSFWKDGKPPSTVVAYWQSEVDNPNQGAPTEAQLTTALASNNPQTRWAARNYLSLCRGHIRLADLVRGAAPGEEALWTAVASCRESVRTREIDLPALERIRQELNGKSSLSISPGVKVIAAMELGLFGSGPLAGTPEADSAMAVFEQVARSPLSSSEISSVRQDMLRMTRRSKMIREKLTALKPQWDGFSKDDVDALDNTDIFSLP